MKKWLVVPMYNEASRFDYLYWDSIAKNTDFIIVFVNDGSSDATLSLLEEHPILNSHILSYERNRGKAEAIRFGINFVSTQTEDRTGYVAFLDSDGAFNSAEVKTILNSAEELLTAENLDALWTSRIKLCGRKIERNPQRHFIGRFIATFLGIGQESFPYDTQSGFKIFVFSHDFLRCIDTRFETRWFVDLELFSRFKLVSGRSMKIREIPLENWREITGSRINFFSIGTIFAEIILIKRLLIRSKKGN